MSITPTLLESTPKVCKHGDRWNLVYIENGKQQRRYIGKGSLTQKEAERKANEMIARLLNGDAPKETKGDTLKELLEEVLEVHLLELRKETAEVFRCTMRKYFAFIDANGFAETKGSKITHEPIEAYRVERLKSVKANTVRKEVTSIKALYNRLNKQDKINVDTRKVVCQKGEEAIKRTYTQEELKTLLEYAKEHDKEMYVLYCMVYYGFIRPAEAMRLTWENIDLERGYIMIPGNKSKNKKTETVIIRSALMEALSELKAVQSPDKYAPVLSTLSTTVRTNANRIHKNILKKAGLDAGLTIYALKHTGVQEVYSKMNNLKMVQVMCRHSNSAITDKYLRGLGFNQSLEDLIRGA